MHQQTDTDDLTAFGYNIGFPNDFLLPHRRWSNVQVVAYNPFKFIPLSRLDRRGENINDQVDKIKDQPQGIPSSRHLIWMEKSADRTVFKNPSRNALHQRTYVSRGTMTHKSEMKEVETSKKQRMKRRRPDSQAVRHECKSQKELS